jgi:hypothetical protein
LRWRDLLKQLQVFWIREERLRLLTLVGQCFGLAEEIKNADGPAETPPQISQTLQ